MTHSYEKVNYSLRPAKCVERKMLCDTFRRLSIFGEVASYNYIGMGSTYFSDFVLFHKSLNISNMISIEKDEGKKERFEFNQPFQCIDLRFGTSNQVLPSLSLDSRSIIWLDYDGKLSKEVLLDINWFCTNAYPGSLLIISVNVQPAGIFDIEDNNEMKKSRLDNLKEAVGERRVPDDIKEKDLSKWGTAKVCRRIIYNEILDNLTKRNGIKSKGNELCYSQLFNFFYSDDAKMLTTGGIVFEESQNHLFQHCAFEDFPFIRKGKEPFMIEIPNLTFKEIRHIDKQLPKVEGQQISAPAIRPSDIEKYEKLYRYFPAFTEANL